MAITMFDQMQLKLACGHVVLGRLDGHDTWTCEECGKSTDSQSALARDPVRARCFRSLVTDRLEFRTGPSPRGRHI